MQCTHTHTHTHTHELTQAWEPRKSLKGCSYSGVPSTPTQGQMLALGPCSTGGQAGLVVPQAAPHLLAVPSVPSVDMWGGRQPGYLEGGWRSAQPPVGLREAASEASLPPAPIVQEPRRAPFILEPVPSSPYLKCIDFTPGSEAGAESGHSMLTASWEGRAVQACDWLRPWGQVLPICLGRGQEAETPGHTGVFSIS